MKTTKIVVSIAMLAAITVAVATPQILGERTEGALASIRNANPTWLAIATLCFAGGFLTAVYAWRTAFAASGGRISMARGTASLGVGALVNTLAPARLGDAVKIALFSRSIEGRDPLWTAGGVYAAVSASRCLVIAACVVAASLTGALPLWPVFLLCGGVAVVGAFALSSARWRRYPRLAHLLDGFAALERSPRFGAQVLAWSAGTALTRLAGTAALSAALGLPHPLILALVICPALDLASAIPLTPGNLGVASGALAVALRSRGIGVTEAMGMGIAIQGLETVVSVTFGTAGALYFANPARFVTRYVGRRAVSVAAVGLSAALALVLGAVFFDLT